MKILKEKESQQVSDALLVLIMICISSLFLSAWLGFIKFYEFLTF